MMRLFGAEYAVPVDLILSLSKDEVVAQFPKNLIGGQN